MLLTRPPLLLAAPAVSTAAAAEAAFSKSFLHMWAIIPAAKASPRTLIMVRKRSLGNKQNLHVTPTVAVRSTDAQWTGFNVTHRTQSMATISEMSAGGNPTEVRTITMVTRPAWGIPAAPMLAAVAVMLLTREPRCEECERQPFQHSEFPWAGNELILT